MIVKSDNRRRSHVFSMKTVVLCNQKGGVGKSAVATILSHYFASQGRRVLAIDLDHQGNLSTPLRLCGRAALASFSSDALLTEPRVPVPDQPLTLVPASGTLIGLERQPLLHTPFARNFRAFVTRAQDAFDVCIVDTNPNPDIRLIAALASCDLVLSPIQLNKEALDGVGSLLNHPRVGLRKIRLVLNQKLAFMGLLPTVVEPTPFQKANFVQVIQRYGKLMIPVGSQTGQFAHLPKRSAIAEAQASGEVLWEMKKTAARDTWREIEPSVRRLAEIILAEAPAVSSAFEQDAAA